MELPLTTDAIRKAARRAYLASTLGSFWLLIFLAAAVVFIVGAVRLFSKNAI